ncbi:MAG: LOG family protein [Rickettsiales bacterium]
MTEHVEKEKRGIFSPTKVHVFGNGDYLKAIRQNLPPAFEIYSPETTIGRRDSSVGDKISLDAGKADGFILCPNMSLYDVSGLIDETTVGNPLFNHMLATPKPETDAKPETSEGKEKKKIKFNRTPVAKPRALIGTPEKWEWLFDVLEPLFKQNMLRFEPDEFLPIFESADGCYAHIAQGLDVPNLQRSIPENKHAKRDDILYIKDRSLEHKRPASDEVHILPAEKKISIAYFGSAGTRNKVYLDAARKAAELAAADNYDMVHGGGIHGIMGALTLYARQQERPPFVTGVTVCDRYGAPSIGLETKNKNPDDHLKYPDLMVYTKDMTARMKEFGKRSHAYVLLPGGIGSLHELLQVARDKIKNQAHTHYKTLDSRIVSKPLVVVNIKDKGIGLWDGLIPYLKEHEPAVAKQIVVVETVEEAHSYVKNFLTKNQPDLSWEPGVAFDYKAKAAGGRG